jgi:hypothetical protein
MDQADWRHLEHVGIPGFIENKEALYDQADDESGEWENFFQTCHEFYRDRVITASEIALEIEGFGSTIALALPGALTETRGSNQRQDFKRLLGSSLAKRAEGVFGDYKVVRMGLHPKKKVAQWKFVKG